MYGQQPCSRWSCVTMPTSDGILVLGGVNLNSYCKMRVHNLSILNYGGVPKPAVTFDDEKTFPLSKQNLDKRINDLNISPLKKQTNSLYTESRIGGFEDNILFDFDNESGMYNMWKIQAL